MNVIMPAAFDLNVFRKLLRGELTVEFTKVDGTTRSMRCTRNLELVPAEFHPKGGSDSLATEENETGSTAIKVFDLDKKAWRSFRLSSVISYSV